MPYTVEIDEAFDPVHIRLLGPVAVVAAPDRIADAVQQALSRTGDGRAVTCVHNGAPFNLIFYAGSRHDVRIQLIDDKCKSRMAALQSAF